MPNILSPQITVSIVSHGQGQLLAPLLQQLDCHCQKSIKRIILTENKSTTKPPQHPGTTLPVTIIHNNKPKGFGENHNAAFSHCDTDWFLVLNPDIRIEQDLLTPLISHIADQTGLISPRIYEPGSTAPEPYRALLTPLEIFSRRKISYIPPRVPAWIPGMFMLFRSNAFREIGGFDTRFFMYGEDFDICARLRLAGWNLNISNNYQAVHLAQRASTKSTLHLWWHFSSLFKVWSSPSFWKYRKLYHPDQAAALET